MAAGLFVAQGLVYGASGKSLDVYRCEAHPGPLPTVLLWHGRGPDERDVLAPLARAVAAKGALVLVPDWRADSPDGGRSHLRESAAFAAHEAGRFGGDPERTVLAGWSLGAKSAIGLALNPGAFGGWRPRAVVGIAGGYETAAPTTGTVPMDDLLHATGPLPVVPVLLVHGAADTVVDIRQSRALRDALERRGAQVTLEEVDADHAGVVMTEYVPELGRCRPGTAGPVLAAGRRTAGVVARAAGITEPSSGRLPDRTRA